MRTRTLFSLTRLITTTTTSTTSAAGSLRRFSLLRALSSVRVSPAPVLTSSSRFFSTRQAERSLSDNSPNWSNRPPKETILLDGCDFEHWLVVTKDPPQDWTRDQIIDSYIKTLANVVGSEDEAKMKIYSVSSRCYFAFGALVSEELSYKLKELPNVKWVLPDSFLDVSNKDYGGEPFIDGQAVPYDPKYHEEWLRNNAKAKIRNTRDKENRPRSNRTRNFDRGQGSQDFRNNPNPAPMGGMPNQPGNAPNNAGYRQNTLPNNNAGYRQNTLPNNNAGYRQYPPPNSGEYQQNMPPNAGRGHGHGHGQNMTHSNAGFAHNMPPSNAGRVSPDAGYSQNMQPANTGHGFPNVGYSQNMPQGNPGFAHNMPPQNTGGGARNTGYGMPQNNPGFGNVAGAALNYSGQGNPGYQNNSYQPTQWGGQQNYGNMGGNPGGGFQGQDLPGRDTPQY